MTNPLAQSVKAEIHRIMQESKVTRAELARRINVKPPRITDMLDGPHGMTILTANRIFAALGVVPEIRVRIEHD